MLQSPAWLPQAQRNLLAKNRRDPAGERLVVAGNSLLDLCRFVEILLNKINQETSTPLVAKTAQKFGGKLAAIWGDLYLAVEHLRDDCKRSGALVRHAAVELLNLGVKLEDGRSYPDVWAQKFVSRLEVLSAGIADAYELLPRIPMHTKERRRSIKNVLSQNASITRRDGAEKRIVTFNDSSDANAGLAREIAVICEAVNELVAKFSLSDPNNSETIRMFKLCAARLKSIQSLPYSLKRWELELHRAHYIFRQAARQLSIDYENASQDTANFPKNLPYTRIADYICDRFEDTVERMLREADSGYARHNFTIRKQSVRTPSRGVLRSPITTPVRKDVAVSHTFTQPDFAPVERQQAANLQNKTAVTSASVVAVISPPSNTVANAEPSKPGIGSKIKINDAENKTLKGNAERDGARQKRLTQDVTEQRQSGARAVTMSVYWQEIQNLSDQQRSEKKRV